MSIDAMKMALEALKEAEEIYPTLNYSYTKSVLRAAIEAERQEPSTDKPCKESNGCPTELAVLQRFWREAKKVEPVAMCIDAAAGEYECLKETPNGALLYTTPQPLERQEPVVDDKLLLRQVFSICEASEDECHGSDDAFKRGRAFEAKRIRNGIGNWYQDTFCGKSFMGEPVEAFAYAECIESPDGVPDVVFYPPEKKLNSDLLPLYTTPQPAIPAWQPIETAPRDGTDIIVMYMHIDTQVIHAAFWNDYEDAEEDEIGWWSYEHSEVSRIKLDSWMTPTHWMPLPSAPKEMK